MEQNEKRLTRICKRMTEKDRESESEVKSDADPVTESGGGSDKTKKKLQKRNLKEFSFH